MHKPGIHDEKTKMPEIKGGEFEMNDLPLCSTKKTSIAGFQASKPAFGSAQENHAQWELIILDSKKSQRP